MIIVTGAAGFIGSCVLARLNSMGREDIIVVDHLGDSLKKRNLEGKKYAFYFDKIKFKDMVLGGKVDDQVECVIHMGACSSTILKDAKYYQENNFEYTKILAEWALAKNIRFIYASSAATYGAGEHGYKDDTETIAKCTPLNLYGASKQKFDQWALDHSLLERVVGLKFFNVFGPNEYHKGEMKSVVAKAYPRVAEEGKMVLFKSHRDDYKHGEQRRDFIYVKDAVDVVIFFLENSNINGIFNVGTGKARTWNDLAFALFKSIGKTPDIEYIDMPEDIRSQYQYFTEANIERLRSVGYEKPFMELEDSIADYVSYLETNSYL